MIKDGLGIAVFDFHGSLLSRLLGRGRWIRQSGFGMQTAVYGNSVSQ